MAEEECRRPPRKSKTDGTVEPVAGFRKPEIITVRHARQADQQGYAFAQLRITLQHARRDHEPERHAHDDYLLAFVAHLYECRQIVSKIVNHRPLADLIKTLHTSEARQIGSSDRP